MADSYFPEEKMDLSLTPEQEMLKTAVRSFVQQEYPKAMMNRQ